MKLNGKYSKRTGLTVPCSLWPWLDVGFFTMIALKVFFRFWYCHSILCGRKFFIGLVDTNICECKENTIVQGNEKKCLVKKKKNGKWEQNVPFSISIILPNKFNYMIKGSRNQSVILNIWFYKIVFLLMTSQPLNYDQFICRAFLLISFSVHFPYSPSNGSKSIVVSLSPLSFKKRQIYNFVNIEHPKWFSGLSLNAVVFSTIRNVIQFNGQ